MWVIRSLRPPSSRNRVLWIIPSSTRNSNHRWSWNTPCSAGRKSRLFFKHSSVSDRRFRKHSLEIRVAIKNNLGNVRGLAHKFRKRLVNLRRFSNHLFHCIILILLTHFELNFLEFRYSSYRYNFKVLRIIRSLWYITFFVLFYLRNI